MHRTVPGLRNACSEPKQNHEPVAKPRHSHHTALPRNQSVAVIIGILRIILLLRSRSVPALNEETRTAQRGCEIRLDTGGFHARYTLQVQRWTGEDLESALEHAAGGTDAGLVLIESLRRRVVAHAHVHPIRTALPVAVIEEHEVEVRFTFARSNETGRDLITTSGSQST